MNRNIETWCLEGLVVSRWVEGMFTFEVEKVLRDQVLCGRDQIYVVTAQDERIKITGEKILIHCKEDISEMATVTL